MELKAGWERTKPMILPDHPTISVLLKEILNGKSITRIEPLGGGLSNSNLKLTLQNEETIVLLIYNDGGKKAEIEKEVLQLVQGKLPVPEVFYHDFSLSTLEYPFVVLSWVDGFQLSELFQKGDPSDLANSGNEVGRHLAEMHSIQFSSPGFFDATLNVQEFEISGAASYLAVMDEILRDRPVIQNLGSDMVHKIGQFAKEQAPLLDHLGNQSSLVHSDFNALNILVEREGNGITVTGILDWEFAFSNSPLIDIANMLRYENGDGSSFMGPFISSYRDNGGILPQHWLQQAKLLDLIALCDLANKEDCGEVRLRDLQKLIRQTMNEWDSYSTIQVML
ncbi:phosphotransferase family protein [Planomicrobium okeanokoites]|uniref:phosphotransferase family protein n=1 Tax=Planomicrobium okeanokoites TaxID=244 RepID=UPI00248F95D3|nr:aminoglycoside phosphotransferase family protein [Planomicrobium okeanokoites]